MLPVDETFAPCPTDEQMVLHQRADHENGTSDAGAAGAKATPQGCRQEPDGHCCTRDLGDNREQQPSDDNERDASTTLDPWGIVGVGGTGIINKLPGGTHVEKIMAPEEHWQPTFWLSVRRHSRAKGRLEHEYWMYRRLPRHHPRLLTLRDDSTPDRLILPYLERGDLSEYLWKNRSVPPIRGLQWCHDAAECHDVLHSCGIVHCDTQPTNFMIDDEQRLRIIDFECSYGGDQKEGCGLEQASYQRPRLLQNPPEPVNDLFALGSLMYTISTGAPPLQGLPDDEIQDRFSRKEWPPLSDLPLGVVIERCWNCEYDSAKQVCDDVRQVMIANDANTDGTSSQTVDPPSEPENPGDEVTAR